MLSPAYLSYVNFQFLSWLPEELHHGIDIRLVIHIFDANRPCVPIHVAIGFCAGKIDRIEISIIGPFEFIGRAAVFEFVAVKRVRLVEYLDQFRNDHIMEGTYLILAASRLCTPIGFEGCFKEEFGLLWSVGDGVAIANIADFHAIR